VILLVLELVQSSELELACAWATMWADGLGALLVR